MVGKIKKAFKQNSNPMIVKEKIFLTTKQIQNIE